MIKNKNKKKGFTLIELIIVIAILAILGAILVPQITGYSLKAKKSKASSDATTICHAIAAYNADSDTPINDDDDLSVAANFNKIKDTVGTWPSELSSVKTYKNLKIVQNQVNYGTDTGDWDCASSGAVTVH